MSSVSEWGEKILHFPINCASIGFPFSLFHLRLRPQIIYKTRYLTQTHRRFWKCLEWENVSLIECQIDCLKDEEKKQPHQCENVRCGDTEHFHFYSIPNSSTSPNFDRKLYKNTYFIWTGNWVLYICVGTTNVVFDLEIALFTWIIIICSSYGEANWRGEEVGQHIENFEIDIFSGSIQNPFLAYEVDRNRTKKKMWTLWNLQF